MERILVVDDEPAIRWMLSVGLSRFGYEVVTAADGQEAIDILNGPLKVDLMILDWRMPRVSGLSVVRELISQKKCLPILILSGAIDIECEAAVLAAVGCSRADVYLKPVRLTVFMEAIKRKLAAASAMIPSAPIPS
jgi:CheY-like chemotaxis protein